MKMVEYGVGPGLVSLPVYEPVYDLYSLHNLWDSVTVNTLTVWVAHRHVESLTRGMIMSHVELSSRGRLLSVRTKYHIGSWKEK